ncbi:MAG: MBL fold metallo-hydrolase [Spirochaetes bacterium]|nr:MBL fold metallo-hydrolase [Spirochaetota bacterium]
MIMITKLLIDRRRAKKARNERVVAPIDNIEAVPSLTVLPLVDFFSESMEAKTEPGVSYLVKAGDFSVLLDVGYNMKCEHPSPLISNMNLFGVNINDIDALFISHHHLDHLGGAGEQRKHTFSLSHGPVDFPPIPVYSPLPLKPSSHNFNPESEIRASLGPVKLAKGVYGTGSIPRALYIMGYTEEQALAVNVAGKGIVLIIGCGHQTVQRVIERAKKLFNLPVYGVIGGLHFPVHGGRIMLGPINLQAVVGTDRMPWNYINEKDVRDAIQAISNADVKFVSLSAHDSSDWAIDQFRKAFGSAYKDLLVGNPLEI